MKTFGQCRLALWAVVALAAVCPAEGVGQIIQVRPAVPAPVAVADVAVNEEESPAPRLRIKVDAQGKATIDGKDVTQEQLPEVIKKWMEGKPEAAGVVITGDRLTGVKHVTAVVAACQAAGVANISLTAADDNLPPPPNVVLILVDDLGYGDLGCYGSKDLRTPNIDRLADEGMRWTQFYANCPVCSPTRAAILTGRYQEAVGVPGVIRTHANNSWGWLASDAELLPALLKPGGYRTVMVGKWHLGLDEPNLPNLRGFDFFYGFLGDMMDDYYTHRRHGINYMRLDRREIDPEGHATDLFSDWAAQWIAHYRGQEPFFMYLPYNAPHNPIQPPEEFVKKYRERHPEATEKRAKLAAFIEHLDAGVGRVLDVIKAAGRENDTLVIFTSDNGGWLPAEADNGPLRDGKGTVYEGGIRAAMIARWPGHIAPKSTCNEVALSMDLATTILEAGHALAPENLDGVSLLNVLLGRSEKVAARDVFFSRRMPGGTIEAVRSGSYKLLRPAPGKPLELYNLAGDPKEATDLKEKEPAKFEELNKALDAHIARFADIPYRPKSGVGPGEIGPDGPK